MLRTPKGQMAFDDVQLEPDEELIEILGARRRLLDKKRAIADRYRSKDAEAKEKVPDLRHNGKKLIAGVKYWMGEHEIRVEDQEEEEKSFTVHAKRKISFPDPKPAKE